MTYDISLYDMSNFLVFNVTEKINPVYFGKVYGTGGGRIWGNSENTTIDINMITNPNSNFTFVLRDEEDAGDYGFITFVDKDGNITPQYIKEIKMQHNRTELLIGIENLENIKTKNIATITNMCVKQEYRNMHIDINF